MITGLLLIAAMGTGQDPGFTSTPVGYHQIIDGVCGPDSHLAEGRLDEDLSDRRSRFYCDSAIVTFSKITDGRVMIQFVQKARRTTSILGFSGQVLGEDMVGVDTVYVGSEVLVAAEGVCKFFYDDTFQIVSAACGARVEDGGRATVPIVAFERTTTAAEE